jgi:hypothetical protein
MSIQNLPGLGTELSRVFLRAFALCDFPASRWPIYASIRMLRLGGGKSPSEIISWIVDRLDAIRFAE